MAHFDINACSWRFLRGYAALLYSRILLVLFFSSYSFYHLSPSSFSSSSSSSLVFFFFFFFFGFTSVIDMGIEFARSYHSHSADNANGYDFDSSSRLSFPIIRTTGTLTIVRRRARSHVSLFFFFLVSRETNFRWLVLLITMTKRASREISEILPHRFPFSSLLFLSLSIYIYLSLLSHFPLPSAFPSRPTNATDF